MRSKLYISCALFAVIAFTSVLCEAGNVPTATEQIEKAKDLSMDYSFATSEGTNIITPIHELGQMVEIKIYRLAKIKWCVDETFYAIGYKALLNKKVKAIFVPPSHFKREA